jgi:HAD superfamily hydrolase (TIGR01450 family)
MADEMTDAKAVLAAAIEASHVAAKSLASHYDTVLADLDGVIYEGSLPIAGAAEGILALKKQGLTVGFVTNNSSRKSETIAEQLAGFGVQAEPDEIISSGQTGVELMQGMVQPGAKVLVVGGEGLRARVVAAGFELVQDSSGNPDAVIQGFSPDLAWRQLAEASFAIQRGAVWVATNSDWTIPQENGLAPGNGTMVAAVHTATGIFAKVAGKPEPAIYKTALRVFDAKKALFVGDRLDTDILGANRADIDSALVLTGVSTRKDLLAAKKEERPTFIIESMLDLLGPYVEPKRTKHGFRCGDALVESLLDRIVVVEGDPTSVEALRAACSVIWNSEKHISLLSVEPRLYQDEKFSRNKN